MALIAVAADKGSPGVTTAAVAMAAVWPRRTLLAEVDTAGGDLVYRSASQNGGTLDPGTGMLSLAATARRGLAAEQLWDHAQRLSGGLDVLIGLGSAEQAVGLNGQWGTLSRAFADLADSPNPEAAADVIADCGRLGPDSPALELLEHATMVLLVTGTEPEHLARVRDRAAALSAKLHGAQRGAGFAGLPVIGVLVVASDGSKVANQVNHMLIASNSGARVMGVIADDAAGAAQLAGRRRGRVDKSLLVRSVRKVVTDLYQGHEAMLGGPSRHTAPGTPGGQQGPTPPYGQPPQQYDPQQPQPAPPGPPPQPAGYGYPPQPPYQQGPPPEQPPYGPPSYDGQAPQPDAAQSQPQPQPQPHQAGPHGAAS